MGIFKFKNEGAFDRYIRLILGEILIIIGYFWLSGVIQIVSYVFGVISIITAVTGFCSIYKIFGFSTLSNAPKELSIFVKFMMILVVVSIFVGGSYYSNFLSKKIFLDDYSRMNNFYKQTLFYTGKDDRTLSISNYEGLIKEYSKFNSKYTNYHPHSIKFDNNFNSDLDKILSIIESEKDVISNGDLKESHIRLESVRNIFQNILIRNNFSMLAVSLVDFHDAMEIIIDAADKGELQKIIQAYPEVDTKLKAVEEVANDDEIKAIRSKLDEVLKMAEEGKVEAISRVASELKSSFVKVYLKRG